MLATRHTLAFCGDCQKLCVNELGVTTSKTVAPTSARSPSRDREGTFTRAIVPEHQRALEGYGELAPAMPWEVQIGDLLRDGDNWVVVDEEPIEDPADPTMVAISWHDDTDEAGSLAIDPSDPVFLRRPVDVE